MLSVVVPAGENLQTCLKSLENQTLSKDLFEVIVVGYGKTLEEMGGTDCTHVRYLPVDEVWAYMESRAKNFGIRAAKGDLIVCLNDNVLLSADSLKYLLEQHKEGRISYVVSHKLNAGYLDEFVFVLGKMKEERKHSDGLYNESRIDFIACDKVTLEKLNGFDESFIWGGSDIDILQRARKMGCKPLELSPNRLKVYRISDEKFVLLETERMNIAKMDSHIRWGRGDIEVNDKFWGLPKEKKDFQTLSAVFTVKNGLKEVEACLGTLVTRKGMTPISQLVVLFVKANENVESQIKKWAAGYNVSVTVFKSAVDHGVAMASSKGDWVLKMLDTDRFSPTLCEGLLYYMENPIVGAYQVRIGQKFDVRLVRRSNIIGNQIAGFVSVVHAANCIMEG